MGWLEDKLAKWNRNIDEHAGPGISEKILEGAEILTDGTPEQRAEWSRIAMERLAELVPDVEVRERIMTDRACVFVEEFGEEPLLKLRNIFKEKGVDAVLETMCQDTYKYAKPYRDGNVVYETKNPSDPAAFAKAETPYEKQVAYCHCPLAKAAETPVAQPHCCCGGGWYKGIWEFITEKPVRVELLESVMKGDGRCTFAVHLHEGIVR
jgi:hypothetical protein